MVQVVVPSILPVISSYLPLSFNSNFTTALLPISVGYFAAGLYLSKVSLNKRNRNLAIIFCLIFLLIFASSMIIPYFKSSEISYKLDTVIPSLSLFYLVRYYFEKHKFKSKTKYIISTISSLTFGIYLFHSFINYKLYNLGFVQVMFDFCPYIGIIVLEILTFLCAGIITFVLRKIKFIRNFL